MNQQIDLKETLSKVLRKGWIILLLVVVLAAGTWFVSSHYIEKVYQAKTTMFIGKEQGAVGNTTLSDIQASNQLIVDYKEIANSRLIIEPVIQKLNLKMSIEEFRKSLDLEIINSSRLLEVSFSSTDPALAASAANLMAQQLLTTVADIVNVQNIRIVDSAKVPTVPVSPNVNMITFLAGVLGLVVGLLFVYINAIFNDSYASQEAVEKELQLDVVAVIPKFKEG